MQDKRVLSRIIFNGRHYQSQSYGRDYRSQSYIMLHADASSAVARTSSTRVNHAARAMRRVGQRIMAREPERKASAILR